jgi:RNA polymerase sigma-70 factor, ECF subfamily
VRGPRQPPYGEAERRAVEKGLALLKSGEAFEFTALQTRARATAAEEQSEVWEVLTVDVVEGRIQTVRIVRNPDKLGHL